MTSKNMIKITPEKSFFLGLFGTGIGQYNGGVYIKKCDCTDFVIFNVLRMDVVCCFWGKICRILLYISIIGIGVILIVEYLCDRTYTPKCPFNVLRAIDYALNKERIQGGRIGREVREICQGSGLVPILQITSEGTNVRSLDNHNSDKISANPTCSELSEKKIKGNDCYSEKSTHNIHQDGFSGNSDCKGCCGGGEGMHDTNQNNFHGHASKFSSATNDNYDHGSNANEKGTKTYPYNGGYLREKKNVTSKDDDPIRKILSQGTSVTISGSPHGFFSLANPILLNVYNGPHCVGRIATKLGAINDFNNITEMHIGQCEFPHSMDFSLFSHIEKFNLCEVSTKNNSCSGCGNEIFSFGKNVRKVSIESSPNIHFDFSKCTNLDIRLEACATSEMVYTILNVPPPSYPFNLTFSGPWPSPWSLGKLIDSCRSQNKNCVIKNGGVSFGSTITKDGYNNALRTFNIDPQNSKLSHDDIKKVYKNCLMNANKHNNEIKIINDVFHTIKNYWEQELVFDVLKIC
jgi:hypothetical protein